MVFVGGWRSRRRGYGSPYGGGGYGPGYGRGFGRGYGYGGGGNSCMRDLFLVEGGCCLAELLGCGPQLLLVAPSTLRAALRTPAEPKPGDGGGIRARLTLLILGLIRRYQSEISPRRPASCRFTPTCSHYAVEAYERHGLVRGTRLTIGRLLRCRPGGRRGADPVPPAN